MIRVDTNDEVPVYRQLVESVRYEIATGAYAPGESMPATRALARDLEISFHTVRKAYGLLVDEGILRAEPGKGFIVVGSTSLGKSERMEVGARIVSSALQRMTSLGLNDSEIAYLMEEQRSLLDLEQRGHVVVIGAAYRELAEVASDVASLTSSNAVRIMDLDAIDARVEADVIMVPISSLGVMKSRNTPAEVTGFQHTYSEDALLAVSSLMDRETLGLMTKYPDAIGPISLQLRHLTGFKGQILASSVSGQDIHIDTIAAASDLVVHTRGVSRTVRRLDPGAIRAVFELGIQLTPSSVERIRNLFR